MLQSCSTRTSTPHSSRTHPTYSLVSTLLFLPSPLLNSSAYIVLITLTSVSLAWNPYSPAINCDKPPQKATNGKKIVGEVSLPHQPAIQDAVIHVLPAKPARPRAAGGAIGVKQMRTSGSRFIKESTFWTSWEFKAIIARVLRSDGDGLEDLRREEREQSNT